MNILNGYKTYLGVATLIVGVALKLLSAQYPTFTPDPELVDTLTTIVAMAGAALASVGGAHKVVKKVKNGKAAK
jgi:hypothetical protein